MIALPLVQWAVTSVVGVLVSRAFVGLAEKTDETGETPPGYGWKVVVLALGLLATLAFGLSLAARVVIESGTFKSDGPLVRVSVAFLGFLGKLTDPIVRLVGVR